jgi:integrase
MARRHRAPTLEHRTDRLKLSPRGKPYWVTIGRGLALGYRRNETNGSWSGRKSDGKGGNFIKVVGPADDYEGTPDALDYWAAQAKVRELFLGSAATDTPTDTGKLRSVREALDDYADDLATRHGEPGNVSRVRFHLAPSLAAKIVAALTARELKAFRKDLLDKGLAPASVTRTCRAMAAAFSTAAAHDPRIKNRDAWRIGLAALPDEDGSPREHVILTDDQVRAVVASARVEGEPFELFVSVGAVTSARPVQVRRLVCGDVLKDNKLLMPSSRKGKKRRAIRRRPVPIPASLHVRLKAAAKGRPADAPLLVKADGEPWGRQDHGLPFRRTVERIGLDPDVVTYYSLRHTWITKQLIRGTPIRLVADAADTSVAMIEKTYSKYITHHGDDLLRAGLIDLSVPPAGPNVVPLR